MTNQPLSRREFTRHALTTISFAGATVAGCEDSAGDDRPPVTARRPRDARDEAGATQAVEDLLAEVIRRRYPDPRLLPAVLREIRRDLAGDVERSRLLSSYPLRNSDEPAFVFAAFRGDAIR